MMNEEYTALTLHGTTYEGYEISTFGNLRNVKTGNVLKQSINNRGYNFVVIQPFGRGSHIAIRIHRAVAEAFIPNTENKPTVNHIDGRKSNNHVDNLEWATYSENNRHAVEHGLRRTSMIGEKNPAAKLTNDDVLFIREHYEKYNPEYSSRALARRFNVDKSTIIKAANRTSFYDI